MLLSLGFFLGFDRWVVIRMFPRSVTRAAYEATVGLQRAWLAVLNVPSELRAHRSDIPTYELVIKEKNLSELNEALPGRDFVGVLPPDSKINVKADLIVDGKTIPVHVRYRGDLPVHWREEKKSWRVVVDSPEDVVNGMRSFNLIIPWDRGFIIEAFSNARARKLGLAVPKDGFVNLRMNGKGYGIYYFEEHFDQNMLERNQLNADSTAAIYGEQRGDFADLYTNPFRWQTLYRGPDVGADDLTPIIRLLSLLNTATDERFERDVFTILDEDSFYQWNIHSLLMGSIHQDAVHNARFYWDPTSGKLRVLPWDVFLGTLGDVTTTDGLSDRIDLNSVARRILASPKFREERNRRLWEYIKSDEQLTDDLRTFDELLEKYKGDFLLEPYRWEVSNRQFVAEMEEARDTLRKNFIGLRLLVGDSGTFQVIVSTGNPSEWWLDLSWKGMTPLVVDDVTLRPTDGDFPEYTKDLRFDVYEDTTRDQRLGAGDTFRGVIRSADSQTMAAEQPLGITLRSQLKTRPLASSERPVEWLEQETVLEAGVTRIFLIPRGKPPQLPDVKIRVRAKNAISGTEIKPELLTVNNADYNFSESAASGDEFLVDHPEFRRVGANVLELPTGVHVFSRDVIIPQGLTLMIRPGARLRMSPGVSIVSYSPVQAPGTPTSPIVFERLDPARPWGVFAVLNAPSESRLSFVSFSGGSDERKNGVYMSGTADFYGSDVTLESITITEAAADDALNVKNARVKISDSLFRGNSSDAIDFDFVSGQVSNSRFDGNGGDGVDLSGSNELVIRDNVITASGDKGISVGENSSPLIFSNYISSGNFGMAIKDLSNPKIINNVIVGNEKGIASFMKKPFFGGGRGEVWNTILWDNGAEIELDALSSISVRNSDVQGGYEGEGNLDTKPAAEDLNSSDVYGLATPLSGAGNAGILARYLGFSASAVPVGLWRPL